MIDTVHALAAIVAAASLGSMAGHAIGYAKARRLAPRYRRVGRAE